MERNKFGLVELTLFDTVFMRSLEVGVLLVTVDTFDTLIKMVLVWCALV